MNKKIYKCDVCNITMKDKSNFNRHLISKKHKIKENESNKQIIKYECEHCKYKTFNESKYIIHKKKHTNDSEIPKIETLNINDVILEDDVISNNICKEENFINNISKYDTLSFRIKKTIKLIKEKLPQIKNININIDDILIEIDRMPVEYNVYNILADFEERIDDMLDPRNN